MSNTPMLPPTQKSPGAIYLTKQAALETVHSLDASDDEHEAAVALLAEIARSELLPKDPQ
jgi:hypothetical protein